MERKVNVLDEKSFDFAVKTVKLYKKIIKEEKEYVLPKQFLRSGTSIGANVAETNGAISTADFSLKVSIAYKESLETKFWLRSCLKLLTTLEPKNFRKCSEKPMNFQRSCTAS